MEHMIIDEGREQIMARSNRMRIPCQMQIDVLHRHDLGAPSSRPAAFDAKDRSKRRLAQRHDSALAHSAKSHRQSYRGRRFPFTQRRRIDGSDENVSATRFLRQTVERRQTDFCFISSIEMKLAGRQSKSFGDLLDGKGLIGARNVEVAHGCKGKQRSLMAD